MKRNLRQVLKDESGAAMVEYALLVALIALAAIVGLTTMGVNLNTQFTRIGCKIATPSASCGP